jgi:predicted acetyltransferase
MPASWGRLAKVYDCVVPRRPGMMARDERWWQSILADPESGRRGMSPLKCLLAGDGSGPRGYALYRTQPGWDHDALPNGTLSVRELIATDADATTALWADLLTRDLIGEVVARQRPVDDPLLDMLADRRRARAYLTDALWIRLTDIPAALSAPLYPPIGPGHRGDRRTSARQRRPVAAAVPRARRRSRHLRTHQSSR